MAIVEELVGVARLRFDRKGLVDAMRAMRAFEVRAKAMAKRVQDSFERATKIRVDRQGLARASKSFRMLENRSKTTGRNIQQNLRRAFDLKGIKFPKVRGGGATPGSGGVIRGGGGRRRRGGSGLGQGVGIGAGFLGVQMAARGISSLVGSAVKFNAELERTKIAMATVVSAVDEVSFEKAKETASDLFKQLQKDAVTSTATTGELFSVFQGIAGPLRAAGNEYDRIRQISLDTVNSAQVLNIDLPQAARDIRQIVEGRAGVDVRLFSQLRSMKLITEDTKEFNNLAPDERIAKVAAALKEAGKGAGDFENSWAGVTSTLQDIFEILLNKVAGPVLKALAKQIKNFANFLIDNQEKIGAFFERVGEKIAKFVDVFGNLVRQESVWKAALTTLAVLLGILAIKAAAVAAPFILAAAAMAGFFLLAEEVFATFEGKDTMIRRFIDSTLGLGTTKEITDALTEAFRWFKEVLPDAMTVAGVVFGFIRDQIDQLRNSIKLLVGIFETVTGAAANFLGTDTKTKIEGAIKQRKGVGRVMDAAQGFLGLSQRKFNPSGVSTPNAPGSLRAGASAGGRSVTMGSRSITVIANGDPKAIADAVAQRDRRMAEADLRDAQALAGG